MILRLLVGKLIQSSGLVAALLLVCASTACRAESILLSDFLKPGASIIQGDLRFDHFSLLRQDNTVNAPSPDPGKITVSPFTAGEQPGLRFTPSPGLLEAAGTGAEQLLAFGYDVTVTGSSKAIAGSTISLGGRAVGNAFGEIFEGVTKGTDVILPETQVSIDGLEGDKLSDSGAFPPQLSFRVTKSIVLQSSEDSASSRIDQFTQTFQVVPAAAVPEPTSMIPLGTGLVMLAGYTWHRRRSVR